MGAGTGDCVSPHRNARGTVEVESAGENQGATFTARLPLIALRSVDILPEERKRREHPTAEKTAEKNVPFDCPPELRGIHCR